MRLMAGVGLWLDTICIFFSLWLIKESIKNDLDDQHATCRTLQRIQKGNEML
jgi:hypothetical protein